VLWVGPTARGSSFEAVSKRADREWETRLRELSMGKEDQHRIGKAEGDVTREIMRPRPMAGNVRKREIVAEDFGAIAKLLAHGFTRSRPLDAGMGIIDKLSASHPPVTLPNMDRSLRAVMQSWASFL
jgi:hypothetical protein